MKVQLHSLTSSPGTSPVRSISGERGAGQPLYKTLGSTQHRAVGCVEKKIFFSGGSRTQHSVVAA
jgi:hypothetical protein